MIYLVLCIISSSLLMVIFKISGERKQDIFSVIVINYIVAALLGFSISNFPGRITFSQAWIPFAILIGILFILIFIVMAKSTNQSGIAITSVASKMSVIIPITFSIFWYDESITFLKAAGIIMALVSVFLTVYDPGKLKISGGRSMLLPVILFFGAGIIDSLIKYSQATYLQPGTTVLFSSVLFMMAGLAGIIYMPFRRVPLSSVFNRETLLFGLILGVINFGSLYGIIMALGSEVFDSSIIFGINNIGIVLLSVVLAMLIFREKLSLMNKAGILLSIVTIIILSLVR